MRSPGTGNHAWIWRLFHGHRGRPGGAEGVTASSERKRGRRVHAKGDQVYACKGDGGQFSWTLKGPDAQLFDAGGKPFGKHFAGPSWEANDGSRVTGKAVANAPSPDADSIPWLLLSVVSRSGDGVLSHVTSIQRMNTKGGKASAASTCDAAHGGQESRSPYSADYVFFASK